jgi:hypothetical protein
MAISALRSLVGNRQMVIVRVIALAVHFTMARDAAAQAVTGQLIPLMDRQREVALALSSCPSTLAGRAGGYVLEAFWLCEGAWIIACCCLPTDKCPARFSSNV